MRTCLSRTYWQLIDFMIVAVGLWCVSECDAQSKPSVKKSPADGAAEAYALKSGEPHDVLTMVKLPDQALRGMWKRLDNALSCEPSVDSMFLLPVAVSGSYEIECEFTRRTSKEGVAVIFPVGDSSTAIVLSRWTGAASGIATVGGVEAKDISLKSGAAVRPSQLVNGQRYNLKINVSLQGDRATIEATLNDQRFVAWKGLASQVGLWASYSIPCQQAIALIANENITDFHKCELTLKKGGKAYRLSDDSKTDWKNPLTVVADAPPKPLAKVCLDWKGHKYFISEKPMKLGEARKLATQLQGRLLTISSKEEQDFIMKEGRGLYLWMAGWRTSVSHEWRDERNRTLQYFTPWAKANPQYHHFESMLCICTSSGEYTGLHDADIWEGGLHACFEWGEEYPDEAMQPAPKGANPPD